MSDRAIRIDLPAEILPGWLLSRSLWSVQHCRG